MLLTIAFMVAEIIGGIWSGSLALLADAGHMFTDAGALALAWSAALIARRPADLDRTYGYHRVQVLAAFVNGLALLVLAVWIIVEGVGRLAHPVEVEPKIMATIAFLGLLVNIVAFLMLKNDSGHNLNVRAALLHVLSDLLGSVAALIAAGGIILFGWVALDPLLSVIVAGLVLSSAWRLVRRSSHILLEGTPHNLDPAHIALSVKAKVADVLDIHHMHLWSLSGEDPLLTLHAVIPSSASADRVLKDIQHVLETDFAITHATIQIEESAHACDCGLSGAVR